MQTKMRLRLTKSQIQTIKSLGKTGKTGVEISRELGINYHQVLYHLSRVNTRRKKQYRPRQESMYRAPVVTATKDSPDYKALYLKAVALLVENDIIEINF